MSNGWVQVFVPEALLGGFARWRVSAGGVVARPGERIPVAPGRSVVRVEAELALPALWARAALSVPVRVEPGGVTRVRLARTFEPALTLLKQ